MMGKTIMFSNAAVIWAMIKNGFMTHPYLDAQQALNDIAALYKKGFVSSAEKGRLRSP
ncbi:hypothetical protein [Adlercreutzia sp. ZJ141]|uniref:hypothetical protein n=1 Tax=Adlercreutzia sp. ZJ141 TaxID=2709406 RepID=UPI0013EA8867|nr:hypothetical protein [Adlercreutzia sp. ZJ141]